MYLYHGNSIIGKKNVVVEMINLDIIKIIFCIKISIYGTNFRDNFNTFGFKCLEQTCFETQIYNDKNRNL